MCNEGINLMLSSRRPDGDITIYNLSASTEGMDKRHRIELLSKG
jgi:hypothetical protein